MTVTPDVRVGLISETRCLPIIVAFGTQMKFMYFIFASPTSNWGLTLQENLALEQ